MSKTIKVAGASSFFFFCQDLLVELQVEDEGLAKGFHREAALSQMDGLRGDRKERLRQDDTISSFISCEQSVIEISTSMTQPACAESKR